MKGVSPGIDGDFFVAENGDTWYNDSAFAESKSA